MGRIWADLNSFAIPFFPVPLVALLLSARFLLFVFFSVFRGFGSGNLATTTPKRDPNPRSKNHHPPLAFVTIKYRIQRHSRCFNERCTEVYAIMPKQNFNKGLESEGPHRQGEKGGEGGDVRKAGASEGDGTGKKGNKQIGPFDERDDDKRPKVASSEQKSGLMGNER